MKPIRVLHTEWSDGWGGQEIRILQEMLAVRERGVEVFLACRTEAKIREKAEAVGIPVFVLPFRGNTDLKTLMRLISIIRKHHIDIVNTHSGKDTWVGGIAAKLAGIKFIRTRHLSNRINPSRFNFINEMADYIFTTGESVRKSMIRHNRIRPDKIVSIPTGVDEKRFFPHCCDREAMRKKFGISKDQIAIGNVAVLRSFKRHDLLLEAAQEIHRHYPETLFIIAGEGPQRSHLEEIIHKHQMHNYVRLTGHLDNPEELLRALDIFVLSSDSKEGVPQSLIQALMMDLPSVATDVGSVRDLYCNDNFVLIEGGSVQAIRNAIENLIENPEIRSELQKKASACIDSFTRDKMAERIIGIYREILS